VRVRHHLAVLPLEVQGGSHISVAALLQVCLEKQALHLAAFDLLLALNLVEGKLQDSAGGQPGLKKSELDSGGCGRGRSCGCDCHAPELRSCALNRVPGQNATRSASRISSGASINWSTSARERY
jgi:hypothetical protein